ncbi:hypothetical protein Clow_02048 [Corynebacterium lowii]|uniref:Uncharacterized protein n=1 Tax=Corynebacterium lowii TaxID=1544413 RepID=A0A0Q0YEJ0_9CORY|nr:hypothetical protein Clow_02048 [Corynebacterium lowii]
MGKPQLKRYFLLNWGVVKAPRQDKALVNDIQEWTETKLAEWDARIEELREETGVLRAAIEHIGVLRGLIPSRRRLQVPEALCKGVE